MEKKQKRKVSLSTGTEKELPVSLRSANVDFNPDYTYVIQDLKKIGILALAFITFLVVLSFII
ncbi:MAG: hypothetical protein AB9907_12780 [Flexilinea sp.]|jgi:hypothetical protein